MSECVEAQVSATINGCLERILASSETGVAVVYGGCVVWTNPRFRSLVGATGAIALHDVGLAAADGQESVPPSLGAVVQGGALVGTAVLHRLDGLSTTVSFTSEGGAGDEGSSVVLRLTAVESEDDRRRLELSRAQFSALATHAPVAVCVSDVGMRIAFANERMAATWGRAASELLGNGWLDHVVAPDRVLVRRAITRVLAGREASVSFRIERPDGDERQLSCNFAPVEREDRRHGFVGTAEDVTDVRRRQAQLAWQATHDPLTDLGNREHLRLLCSERLEQGRPFALFFIDLDDFKVINDGLGHAGGDALLVGMAARLQAAVDEPHSVCRLGGDEFVVVSDGPMTDARAVEVGDDLLAATRSPMTIDGRRVEISASIGVVMAHGDEQEVELILRDADVAMYQAKRSGKGRVATFDARARREMVTKLEVVNDLRALLRSDRIELAYQPIVETDSLHLVGAEALLRYVHPSLGPISPLDVIELAESSGFSRDLCSMVLRTAVRQMRSWQRQLGSAANAFVSVNVSCHELTSPGFVESVFDVLREFGVDASQLVVELTESHLVRDVHVASEVMTELADAGVRIAIDDFGTGYSSLAYLAQLPFHILKVDKSFVAHLPDSKVATAIVEAVVALSDALGAQVLVEGIERADQLELVRSLGCSLAQGYHLGHPGPASGITEVLAVDEVHHGAGVRYRMNGDRT